MDIENKFGADLFLEVDEDQRELWKIEDDSTADWALDKVKETSDEFKRFETVALGKIEEIKAKLERERTKAEGEKSFFIGKLTEYMQSGVKLKKTKTQETYNLPGGKLVQKLDKQDFKVNKDKMVEYASKNEMYDLIKVKEDFDWGTFKKDLKIVDDKIVNIKTGEVLEVEGLCIEVKPGKFEIKF